MTLQGYYIADGVFSAFKKRDFSKLKYLFDRGVYVDMFDLNLGESLLTKSVAQNDLEMATFLLKNGADPNFRMRNSDSGQTYPILAAAGAAHIEAVSLLIRHGADINATGTYSYETNPVRQALWNASFEKNSLESHIKMLDWLLRNGADPDAYRIIGGLKASQSLKDFVNEDLFASWKMDRPNAENRKAAIIKKLKQYGLW